MGGFVEMLYVGMVYFICFAVILTINAILGSSSKVSVRRRKIYISFFTICTLGSLYLLGSSDFFSLIGSESTKILYVKILYSLFWITAGYLTNSLLDFFLWRGILTENGVRLVPKIMTVIVTIVVYTFFISLMLHTVYGQDLLILFTTSGAIALILGYSAQNVLGQMFSGLSIGINGNVKLGDKVESGDKYGTLIEMNWRAVVLKALDGTTVTISNTVFANSKVVNYSRFPTRRYIDVAVSSKHLPHEVRQILLLGCHDSEKVLKDPPPFCNLQNSSLSKSVYRLKFYCNTRPAQLPSEIRTACYSRLKRAGFALAADNDLAYYKGGSLGASPHERISKQDFVKTINGHAVLGRLNEDEVNLLYEHSRVHMYSFPERVIIEGNSAHSLYLVKTGKLTSTKIEESTGETVKISHFKEGNFFGIKAALTGEDRRITVRPDGSAEVIQIDSVGFKEILKGRPELLDFLSERLAERELKQREALGEFLDAKKHAEDNKETLASKIKNQLKALFFK
jgi:small-conductance mechanosensitive channel/CRP-like cAMP-binding protein